MKKTITKFVLFAACSTAIQAKAQWMEDATTIWTKKTNLNVGIGLSNPTAKLDIYNSTNLNTAAGSVTDIAGFAGLTNSKSALKVQLYRHSDGLDWLSASTRLQAATDGVHQAYLEFNPKGAPAGLALGTASGNAITVNANGNVGIGTTAPTTKLQIFDGGSGVAASELISLRTSYAGNSAAKSITWKDGPINITGQIDTRYDGTKVNMVFGHLYNGGYSNLDLMTILGNGNVGVGTLNPTKKLEVLGDIKVGGIGSRNYLKVASSEFPEIRFQTPTDDETMRIGVAASDRAEYGVKNGDLYFYSGITNRMDLVVPKAGGVIMALGGGNVGIGTTNPTQKLSVNGTIQAKEIVVNTGWSDFVFDDNYKLRPLTEVEQFVKTNKHLPEIPSQKEVEKNGVQLGDISSKLLMKIEELTLYMIEMKKENEKQQKQNDLQQKEIEKQKAINNILMSKIEKLETKQ